ncbi:MAG: MbnP family protein [Bacteroidia bacterium]
MNFIVSLLCLSMSLAFTSEVAGKDIWVCIKPSANNISIAPGQFIKVDKDSVRLDILRFYLSELTFMNENDTAWTEPQGYRLMDIADTSSLKFHSYIPDDIPFDRIRFRLGVDSLSSSTGAHTGALDPANGMYWAWHTGYINLKIEGSCNLCPNPTKAFALHIGGFQFPMNAERSVELMVSDPIINIQFDLALILESILSKPLCNIMTPGEPSMRIADMAAQSFSVVK